MPPLPFLKKKQGNAGLSIEYRKPDQKSEEAPASPDEEMQMIASELIEHVHNRDAKKVAECLMAAFELADSMPHEEGEHINEE